MERGTQTGGMSVWDAIIAHGLRFVRVSGGRIILSRPKTGMERAYKTWEEVKEVIKRFEKFARAAARTLFLALLMGFAWTAKAKTMEVYVNVPQGQSVHCMNADVEWDAQTLMVTVKMPWGVTYYTHMSNVVLVERKPR